MTDYQAEADRLRQNLQRSVTLDKKEAAAATVLTISHVYRTDVDDLWNAIVDKDRLARWFGKVTGDFHVGGSYSVENNASGVIRTCEAPREFTASWDFGGGTTDLRVTLTPEGDSTRLTLEHSGDVPYEFYDQFGPGATGVGWEGGLLGLAVYLAFGTDVPLETTGWGMTDAGVAFIKESADGWADAAIAAGESEGAARAAAARTAAFFSGTAEG